MNNLDILRAFAVLAVFLAHANHFYKVDTPFFGVHGGWFGVQLFFLLSGYLIIQSAAKYPLRIYFIHRALRILPIYLIAFLGLGWSFKVFSLSTVGDNSGGFLINLLLLQHLSPSALFGFDSLHVSWTLTVEVLWYLLAPALVWPLRRAPHLVLFLSFVLSTTWAYLATNKQLDWIYDLSTYEQGEQAVRYLFINNAFPAQLCFFVLGAYLYYQREKLLKINTFFLATVFFILLAGWPQLVHKTSNPNFLSGVGLSALFIIALQSPVWNNRSLKWVADISYSVYLLHFSVILFTLRQLEWRGLSGMLGALALTLMVSSVSYLLIEKPAMRWARRFKPTAKA